MITLTINNQEVTAAEGQKLIDVANSMGIDIPTMCMNADLEHFTSCMVCLVKDCKSGKLLPSCSVRVENGMDILTMDDEIREARKTALDLLLSEHVGDCEAPCRIACPAFMDIPQMNRLIAEGLTDNALAVVMNDIALPGVLGRICPAPCEGACKRKPIDQAVSICLLKRYAADHARTIPRKETPKPTGKKVAVIGAGPAGLAAAYYLQTKGIQAIVFDNQALPGGSLRYTLPDEKLDKQVLNLEIRAIEDTGVEFMSRQHIDSESFKALQTAYDAVVVATGNYGPSMNNWGLENNGRQIIVDKKTYLTNIDRVFAIGNANRSMQLAIRSQAQGKEVAIAIEQLLSGKMVVGEKRRFNSSIGKLLEQEYAEYLKEGTTDDRQEPEAGADGGMDAKRAQAEAARCLHCDCRKPDHCRLRDYADDYGASGKRFRYAVRKPLKKYVQQSLLVYEPGKCIKCGICVRLTGKYSERFGFTFIGRGFDVEIGVPFGEDLDKALEKTARKVAEACPTGALSVLSERHDTAGKKADKEH